MAPYVKAPLAYVQDATGCSLSGFGDTAIAVHPVDEYGSDILPDGRAALTFREDGAIMQCTIYLRVTSNIRHTALHELGHCFGLAHDSILDSAMTPGGGAERFTNRDLSIIQSQLCQ